MRKEPDLIDLISNDQVVFSCDGKPINTDLPDYGEDNQFLAARIVKSGQYITIAGCKSGSIERQLAKPRFTQQLTDFIVYLYSLKPGHAYRVDADIEKVSMDAYKEKTWGLVGGILDSLQEDVWPKRMPLFDRAWTAFMCDASSNWMGNGYEWPSTKKSFSDAFANHAAIALVGNDEQLKRYERFAGASFGKEILKNIKRFSA